MIYIVEDDNSIRELVAYTLENSGFEACGCADSTAFFAALKPERAQLVLLDIMLPGEDGISILRRLRADAATRELPVIMVTARGSEFDKVTGLDAGADDYIAKPFGMMELIARIRAVLRRRPQAAESCLTAGNVALYPREHRVTADGEAVVLTFKEFELLQFLLEHKGAAIGRDEILESVWGYISDIETRTVDVHIRTLRQKLGHSGDIIETVRGIGYRIGGGA